MPGFADANDAGRERRFRVLGTTLWLIRTAAQLTRAFDGSAGLRPGRLADAV